MLKVLILSTNTEALKWKSLPKKLSEIEDILNTVKNGKFEVTFFTNEDLKPEVVDGRITHKWFDDFSFPLYERGYDFVLLHFSGEQKKQWGILPTLGGSSHTNDGDLVGEAWFWADEKSTRKGRIRFVETCLHEMSHLLAKGTHVIDETHVADEKKGTVKSLFKTYDMSLYLKQEKEISRLQKLITLLKPKQPTTLHKRLPEPYNEYITQGYGVKNSAYKATGHHIGVDYGVPLNTSIYAPWNGEVTVTGTHGTLGNFCYFEYEWEGKKRVERFLHLIRVPERGKYKRGEVVAYSGNTGMSTGPHFHCDGWWDEVNTSIINAKNFTQLTYNPHI